MTLYQLNTRKTFVTFCITLFLAACGGDDSDNSEVPIDTPTISSSSSSSSSSNSSNGSASTSSGGIAITNKLCSDIVASGKALYQGPARCSQCHDADSPTYYPANFTKDSYQHASSEQAFSLTEYIAKFMPPNGEDTCGITCSEKITAYVRSLNSIEWCPSTNDTERVVPLTPIHRLNILQFENVVRELTGVEIKATEFFSPDSETAGFDNVAESLNITADRVSLYVSAAEKITNLAFSQYPSLHRNLNLNNCDVQDEACIISNILGLAENAYRRPLKPTEKTRLQNLHAVVKTKSGLKSAYKEAVKTVLLSPNFLFIALTKADIASEHLDSHVIAHRLASFLWAGLPDDTLLQKARSGTLAESESLTEEVRRMLRDNKSQGFIDGFVTQWLSTRELKSDKSAADMPSFNARTAAFAQQDQCNTTAQCKTLFGNKATDCADSQASNSICMCGNMACQVQSNSSSSSSSSGAMTSDPGITNDIKTAMSHESELFIKEFLKSDIPLSKLVDPDFSFRNNALAQHYNESLPGSDTMVKVNAGQRRGVFMLGGWLTTQSDAEETSPLARGNWVLEHLTCTPMGAPPPDAPASLPAGTENLSNRERLALHRINPTCASCHDFIDPAGLGFEYFDEVGVPRSNAIDSSGALPGGFVFNSPLELPDLLSGTRIVSDCLTRKLYQYAAGRLLTEQDDLFIQDILDDLDGSESMVDVITKIVLSPSFRSSPSIEMLNSGSIASEEVTQ